MRVKSSGFAVHFFKRRITQILLILFLFLVGVTAGAVCRNMLSPEIQERLSGSFLSFFTSFGQVGVGTIFQNTLSNLLQQVGLAVIFTLTLTGVLLLPVLAVYSGFLYGLTLGLIIGEFGISGICFNALYFLPRLILVIPLLLVFFSQCFTISCMLASRVVFANQRKNLPQPGSEIVLTLLLLVVLIICIFAASFLEAYLTRFIVLNIFQS